MLGSDVCYAPVLSLAEAPKHPHNVARQTFVEIDGVMQPAPAPRFSRTVPEVQGPPRGADNDAALAPGASRRTRSRPSPARERSEAMMSTLPGTTGRRRIYLMRHGHVDYHGAGRCAHARHPSCAADAARPYGGAGRRACAGRCRARPRDLFRPAAHAQQTAELVLDQMDVPPELETDPELVEIQGGRPKGLITSRKELVATMSFHFARAAEEGATMMEGGEVFAVCAGARGRRDQDACSTAPDWRQILIVAHEGMNRLVLSWAAGAGLAATSAFEQDTGCINVLDFDMVPAVSGRPIPEIERVLIKAVNLTPYNYVKHGMNLTSLEAIFDRDFAQEKIEG